MESRFPTGINMAYNYKAKQDLVIEKLNYYGQDFQLIAEDMTTVLSTGKAIFSSIDASKHPDNLVDRFSGILTCTVTDADPTTDLHVRWDGKLHKIGHFDSVRLTDVTILYQLYLSI